MKYHYDDLLEALMDAEHPLALLLAQHRRDGFGIAELCSIDIQVLYTIQDELEHMIDRIKMKRWKKEMEERGWTQSNSFLICSSTSSLCSVA